MNWILLALIGATVVMGLKTVQQGNVAVVTIFGKYRRIIRPGLNFMIPFIELIFKKYLPKTDQWNWSSKP